MSPEEISNTPLIFRKVHKRLSPPQMISLSFLGIIIFGGFLLSLPFAHAKNVEVTILDAFFTSVSAVCVTGLVTLTTASAWSIFGKLVILILVQIGGLSLITVFTFFMVNIGKKISLKSRLAIQATFNHSSPGGMVKMVILVIKGTLVCEFIGAMLLFVSFVSQGIVWYKALFYGVFHSISAFCNAGFDIIGDESLIPFVDHYGINITIMALVIIGGIGFMVWQDLLNKVKYKYFKKCKQTVRLSLHTKLALILTGVLLVSGTILFLLIEYNNPKTLGPLNFPEKVLAAAFHSVMLRTAGFATIAQDGLTETSKFLSSIFMMIGGSPGGTAGGIKTVTLAIIFCSVWSILKGRKKIVSFERTISVFTLQKALTIIVLMFILLFIGTGILSITENHTLYPHGLLDIIFEVSSALGTTGLNTGITPFLSVAGKLMLMLFMFVGRIGPITLIISMSHNLHRGSDTFGYPDEDVMIG